MLPFMHNTHFHPAARPLPGVGILYESEEWSSHALESQARACGLPAFLVNLETVDNLDVLAACGLVVNRIFASSWCRGHRRSLERMPEVFAWLQERRIPVINSPAAHFYEIDKDLTTRTLLAHGLPAPQVYGVFRPHEAAEADIPFPCILKPNCGGRTTHTHIVHDREELIRAMTVTPDIPMLAEEYLPTSYGFVTRIEAIGGECRLILRRGVVEGGLSAYHLGSPYAPYPDCSERVRRVALDAMRLLSVDMGSLDIIENERGCFIIDVNAVSNASEDNTAMFSFDLMRETARHVARRYAVLMEERHDFAGNL